MESTEPTVASSTIVAATYTASGPLKAIAGALAKAQGMMTGASKDARNPHFQSKYADLASVVDACRLPLSTNGLAVVQPVRADGKRVTVTTMLLHGSGEWIATELVMEARDSGPQAIGSAITYGRRYGLAALVGIAPEDDDGEGAEGRASSAPRAAPRAAPRETRPGLTAAQVDALVKELRAKIATATDEAALVAAGAECNTHKGALSKEDVDGLIATYRDRVAALKTGNGAPREPGTEG